jgi:ribokinase
VTINARANALLVQLEIPLETVGYALATAAQHGALVVLNPAPARPVPDEWFGLVDVWVPNEREAEGLTGIAVTDLESAERAAKALLDRGAKSVVITLGANGALLVTPEVIRHFPAVRLAEGAPLDEAIRFANAAGALACTKVGAQPSMPTRHEVENFLATHAR